MKCVECGCNIREGRQYVFSDSHVWVKTRGVKGNPSRKIAMCRHCYDAAVERHRETLERKRIGRMLNGTT